MSDLPELLRLLISLGIVLCLMGGLTFLIKKSGLATSAKIPGAKRLKLVESLPLDARRRLVLIQRDHKQHLVILGINGETVIETDIEPKVQDEVKS